MNDYEESINKIKQYIKVGYKYKIYYCKNNINNETIYVRAIIDNYQVVYCRYSRRKGYYIYYVESLYRFVLLKNDKYITRKGKSNI